MDEAKNKEFLEELKNIYEFTDTSLSGSEKENNCGSCFYCCSSRSNVNASKLELHYLSDYVKSEDREAFGDFVSYKKNREDYLCCPLYDREVKGCKIYKYRPYGCRLQGNIKIQKLPNFCVYFNNNPDSSYKENTYEDIPGFEKYNKLNIKYDILVAENIDDVIEAYMNLGKSLFIEKKNQESLDTFNKILNISPEHIEAQKYVNILKNLLVTIHPIIKSSIINAAVLTIFANILPLMDLL